MPQSSPEKVDKPPNRPSRSRPGSAQLSRSASTVLSSGSPTKNGSTPPISTLRPRPPSSRSRRSSLAASSNMSRSSSDQSSVEYTRTVEERTEEALGRASREALQDALRSEWAVREKVSGRVEELESAQEEQERRIAQLEKDNEVLKAKHDAAFEDQTHLESELESANELIELLRSNLAESERQCRLGARRYADQEKAFDAERTVHQADQQHLIQRIKSLTTERIASPGGHKNETEMALQEELASLTASHQTLVAQLTTLADELHEVKTENARLIEENSSWQLLIEERTLAGSMRGGLISASEVDPKPLSTEVKRQSSSLDTLEEQQEMDELHGELDTHFMTRMASPGHYVDLSSPIGPNGPSLATEMGGGMASIEALETLRNENKALGEANKALQLYCTKILDRILAQEGFEHVLAVDYRTRRGTLSAIKKQRLSVLDMAQHNEAITPPERSQRPPSMPIVSSTKSDSAVPRSRPVSMYSPVISTATSQTEKKEDADSKKARRGFSIDFRALGFGAPEKVETKPQLKPLRLASRASLSSSSPPKSAVSPIASLAAALPKPGPATAPPLPPLSRPPLSTTTSGSVSPIPGARKLEPQEEDEEDRRARSHMEAQLKLLGLDKDPETQITSPEPTGGAAAWIQKHFRSSSKAANMPVPERDDPTPVPATAEAEAALRAFDAAEREEARLLEKGKGSERDSYTAPPKIAARRARHSASRSSVGGSGESGSSHEEKGHRTRESGSTLWSIGSTQE